MTKEEIIKKLTEEYCQAFAEDNVDGAVAYNHSLHLVEQIDEPYWHTEEPTEEGEYLVCVVDWKDLSRRYEVWNKQGLSDWYEHREFLAWHKIPPYEETV